ncbi:hypothetical protein RRG08_054775, partial [Elysia crispata]
KSQRINETPKPLIKADEDKFMLTDPQFKRPRLEIHESQPEDLKNTENEASGDLVRDIGLEVVNKHLGWTVQLRQPDLGGSVCVHISDDHVTVGVPLTREPLSKRNYIQELGLRAPIAWIMCTLADIKDAHYIGSDNAADQIKVAAENASSKSKKINVALADGLNMSYRDCCIDSSLFVKLLPLNQKHLMSLIPKSVL